MPFNGSGGFTRSMNWVADAAAGIKILASRHDTEDDGFAAGFSNTICKDGQTTITADIPFNGKKITNLAAPVSPTDAVTKAYVDGIKTFSTGIILSGAGVNNRLEYPAADMSFFVRSIGDPLPANTTPRFVWNDKANGTGTDVATLNDAGEFTTSSSITSGGTLSASQNIQTTTPIMVLAADPTVAAPTVGNIYLRPLGYATSTQQVHITETGGLISTQYITANGGIFAGTNSLTLRPNGVASATGQISINTSGTLACPGQISAQTLVLQSNMSCNAITCGPISASGNVSTAGDPNQFYGSSSSYRVLTFGSGHGFYFDSSGVLQFQVNSNNRWQVNGSSARLDVFGDAYKPSGGSWANNSDARIKNVLGDYDSGLDQILALRPVRYTFKGNHTSEPPGVTVDEPQGREGLVAPYPNSRTFVPATAATEYVGLIAQEAETVMPEMVTLEDGYIDGEPVTDLRGLDTSALVFALINAVKTLTARIEELEAKA